MIERAIQVNVLNKKCAKSTFLTISYQSQNQSRKFLLSFIITNNDVEGRNLSHFVS